MGVRTGLRPQRGPKKGFSFLERGGTMKSKKITFDPGLKVILQARRITFQLTLQLALHIQTAVKPITAAKPIGSPCSSPFSMQLSDRHACK